MLYWRQELGHMQQFVIVKTAALTNLTSGDLIKTKLQKELFYEIFRIYHKHISVMIMNYKNNHQTVKNCTGAINAISTVGGLYKLHESRLPISLVL